MHFAELVMKTDAVLLIYVLISVLILVQQLQYSAHGTAAFFTSDLKNCQL